MTSIAGPYHFENDEMNVYRGTLKLWNDENGLVIIDHETSDGDLWFVPTNEHKGDFTGVYLECVARRAWAGLLTVELPTGERAVVEGLDSVRSTFT